MLSSLKSCFSACGGTHDADGDIGHVRRERVRSSILASPLLKACHISSDDISANLDEYIDVSSHMCSNLGIKPSSMSTAEEARIYQYYLPVYVWCEAQRREHVKKGKGPLVLGISAPQGCGKSTLCEQVCGCFSCVSNSNELPTLLPIRLPKFGLLM
jgi:hypothetical protein